MTHLKCGMDVMKFKASRKSLHDLSPAERAIESALLKER